MVVDRLTSTWVRTLFAHHPSLQSWAKSFLARLKIFGIGLFRKANIKFPWKRRGKRRVMDKRQSRRKFDLAYTLSSAAGFNRSRGSSGLWMTSNKGLKAWRLFIIASPLAACLPTTSSTHFSRLPWLSTTDWSTQAILQETKPWGVFESFSFHTL